MQLVSYSNGPTTEETFSNLEGKTRKALGCVNFLDSVVEANDILDSDYESEDVDQQQKINKLTSHLMEGFSHRFSKSRPRYKDLDGFFGTHDRATFSLPKEYLETGADHCLYYGLVKDLLDFKGYELVDYIKGICKKDGREFKIGRILARFTKDSDVINGFANSPIRSGNRKNLRVTVSRNLYDIITMSTFKGWSSCMNILKGTMNYKIDADLNNGTLVVYIHDEKVSDMDKASGRFLLKPFFNKENNKMVLYKPEDSSYGTVSVDLDKLGNALVDEINKLLPRPTNDISKYLLGSGLYNDGLGSDFFYKNTDWDFTNERHVMMINVEELQRININMVEMVKNHPNDKILLSNPLFYNGFDRRITKEDIDYLVDKNVKINNFASHYVNRAKNPHFDIEFAFLIKDYFSPVRLFRFMLEKCNSTDKLSIDDNLFSCAENKLFVDLLNLRASSNFSDMRELSNDEMLILNNIYFSYELKSDALSCSYIKTITSLLHNGERMPKALIRLSTDIVSLIENAFTYEEQCKIVTCLDDGYYWIQEYYEFLSKFTVLDHVHYRGVLSCRYFKEYCENKVPMFKESVNFLARRTNYDYNYDMTLALAS